ncbi:hypothetical protein DAI22_02g112700 [Oryza sativa Japonica Group]|nr:hypothetical protein DAI22_02g112700 [Oryza sativa Japonica Group]
MIGRWRRQRPLVGGASGRRSEGEAEPASDGREAAASGGWDADPRPPTLWRRDPVGEALAAGSGFPEARSGVRRSRGGRVWWLGRGSTSLDLVEAGSGRGGGGGVWQSVWEALAAGRRAGHGSTFPDLVEAGSGGGGRGGVWQSMGEALAAGSGVRWPRGRRGVGGGGRRRSGGGGGWRRDVGGQEE